jgi:hypothetical protein
MNNKQQTAVEWFAQQLYDRFTMKGDGKLYQLLFEQAKEMEKKQIINAFSNGDNTDCTSEQNIEEFADRYYNETYGGCEQ